MKFSIIGDDIVLGGTLVAKLVPGIPATLRGNAARRLVMADAALSDMEGARMEAYEQGSSEGHHDGIIEGRSRQRAGVEEETWEELGRIKAEEASGAGAKK